MTQQEFGQGFSHCTAKGNLSLFPIIPLPSGQTLRHSQIKTLLFYLLCGKAYVRVEISQPKNHSGWFTAVTQPIQSHDGSHDVLDQGLHSAVQTQLSMHCLVVCAIVPSHSLHATWETQQVRKFPFMSQDWVFHCCFHGEIHHARPGQCQQIQQTSSENIGTVQVSGAPFIHSCSNTEKSHRHFF